MNALLLAASLATPASAQIMDLSCMEATRDKADEMIKGYERDGVRVDSGVFREVRQWAQDVQREGHAAQERISRSWNEAQRDADGADAVRAAAARARSGPDPYSSERTRRAAEARARWQEARREETNDRMYRDARAQAAVAEALRGQQRWNQREIDLKEKLYGEVPPSDAMAKHEQAARAEFEKRWGTRPGGDERVQKVAGRLAAMAAVGESMALGVHDAAVGSRGWDNAIEPVRVMMKAVDLHHLHGDMAVRHVQQVAPPVELRRQVLSQPGSSGAALMEEASRAAAVGVQNLLQAEVAAQDLRAVVSAVPPMPAEPSEQERWAREAERAVAEKARERKRKPWTKVYVE